MANGEQFENPANNKVDNLKEETGKNLLADAQVAQPKAVEKVANAPDAPAAPIEKLDNMNASDKTGDKTASKLEQSVTDNIAATCKEKLDSLNGSPEGKKLLTQEHKAGTLIDQLKLQFPLACERANIT